MEFVRKLFWLFSAAAAVCGAATAAVPVAVPLAFSLFLVFLAGAAACLVLWFVLRARHLKKIRQGVNLPL